MYLVTICNFLFYIFKINLIISSHLEMYSSVPNIGWNNFKNSSLTHYDSSLQPAFGMVWLSLQLTSRLLIE